MMRRWPHWACVLILLPACSTNEIGGPPKKGDPVVSPGIDSLSSASLAPADGATQIRLVALVDSGVARDQRAVTFRTSAGTFSGNVREIVIPADSARRAIAMLVAPVDPSTAIVTATAGGGTRRIEVQFEVARAQDIDVVTDQPSVARGFTTALQVTAFLRRSPGVATAGQSISFIARAPGQTTPRGRFASDMVPSDATGRAIVRFAPADSMYEGPLYIIASVAGAQRVLRDSTLIQIVAPAK